jgi:hypothetical protein
VACRTWSSARTLFLGARTGLRVEVGESRGPIASRPLGASRLDRRQARGQTGHPVRNRGRTFGLSRGVVVRLYPALGL